MTQPSNETLTYTVFYDSTKKDVVFCLEASKKQVIDVLTKQKSKSGLYSVSSVPSASNRNNQEIIKIEEISNGLVMVETGTQADYQITEDELVYILAAFGRQPISRQEMENAIAETFIEAANNKKEIKYFIFPTDGYSIDMKSLKALDKKVFNSIKNIRGQWSKLVTERSVILEPYIEAVYSKVSNNAPQNLGRYVLNESLRDNWNLFEWAKNTTKDNFCIAPVAIGSQGSGKTEFAAVLAEYLGWNYVRVLAPDIRTPTDWFYKTHIVTEGGASKTTYVNSELTDALMYTMQNKSGLVVLIDEVNRVSDDSISNPLLGLLDDSRRFLFGTHDENGNPVIVPVNFKGKLIIIRALNNGSQYTGTSMLDSAQFGRGYPIMYFERPNLKMVKQILTNDYPLLEKTAIEWIASVLDATIQKTAENRGIYEAGIRDVKLICDALSMQAEMGVTIGKEQVQKALNYGLVNKFSQPNVRNDILGIIETL